VIATKEDLARKIYSLLRSEDGGSAADDDIALIKSGIDQSRETLSMLDIITIQDTDAVEDGLVIPFCEYAVEQISSEFGRPKSVQAESVAIAKLRFIARTRPTYEPQRVEYF
jgi:hypothetical protein